MVMRVEPRGDVAVITPGVDHLDAGQVEEFKRDIAPALAEHRHVVLDMSPLSFVDSAGLGAILSCLRRLSAADGDLKLCGLSHPVKSVFELARMHRIFDIYDTPEDAEQAFRSA